MTANINRPGGYTAGGYMNQPPKQNFGTFSAAQIKTGAAGMNLLSTYFQTKTDMQMAGFEKFTSEQQARLLLRNADERYAQSTRQAQQIAHQGRRTESDAVAAMLAQGGTTDPLLLAKLNQHSTYAGLAAVFQGEREAGGMRMQAQAIKSAGAMNYANARATAANSKLQAIVGFGTSMMGMY